MLKTKELPKLGKSCPRCGSLRVYASEDEFICLACSYIVVPEIPKKTKRRKLRNN